MKIDDNNFEQLLKEEAKKYGYILDDEVCKNFNIYKELLVSWNEKMNLTAITDDLGIIVKHFIDCLECSKHISISEQVIDIGTGAGFPGMVLAIYYKDKLDITLLDSLNKRLIFLEEVKKKLDFKNVIIVHERAEEAAHKEEFRGKFSIVCSRAVATLKELLEYSVGFLKLGGKCVFMKGPNFQEEINDAKSAFGVLNCNLEETYNYKYNINDQEYLRTILIIKKIKDIASKYPRNYGKIKKNPL